MNPSDPQPQMSLSVMSFCLHLLSFLLLSLFVMSIVHTLEVARMRSGKMGTSNYLSIVRILQNYVNLPPSSKVDAKEALKNVNHIKIACFLSIIKPHHCGSTLRRPKIQSGSTRLSSPRQLQLFRSLPHLPTSLQHRVFK